MKILKSIVWAIILSVTLSTLFFTEGSAAGRRQRRSAKRSTVSRGKAKRSSRRIARSRRSNRSVRASVKRRNSNNDNNAVRTATPDVTPKAEKNCIDCGRKNVKIGI